MTAALTPEQYASAVAANDKRLVAARVVILRADGQHAAADWQEYKLLRVRPK